MHGKFDLVGYNEAQREEILGKFNMACAEHSIGHPPSQDEAAWHYHDNGGPEHFEEHHRHEFFR